MNGVFFRLYDTSLFTASFNSQMSLGEESNQVPLSPLWLLASAQLHLILIASLGLYCLETHCNHGQAVLNGNVSCNGTASMAQPMVL